MNLGMPDFRICVLNGLIAKAPLGDNFNRSHIPYGKGILLEMLPRNIRVLPVPSDLGER